MTDSDHTISSWPSTYQALDEDSLRLLQLELMPLLKSILIEEKIPQSEALMSSLKTLYIPFCAWLISLQQDKPLIVGINGAQGSGKSTATKIIQHILEHGFNKRVITLSIDDFYHSRQQRRLLAEQIHPLLITRGVPGTHDSAHIASVLKHLIARDPSDLLVPVFDKSIDDVLPDKQWTRASGKYDIILFEGWCVGTPAQHPDDLSLPVNALEKDDDPDAIWRYHVNLQLDTEYKKLFSLIDIQLFLKIPNFDKVNEWRQLQEAKLKSSITDSVFNNKTMNPADINRFIMHYERLTRFAIKVMPRLSDVVFEIGDNHLIQAVKVQKKNE